MRCPSARRLALSALETWAKGGQFADRIIHDELTALRLRPVDRSFAQELFYGVLRHLTLLDFLLWRLRPSSVDDTSRHVLHLGLYQLLFLQTPAHAAVFETVKLASPKARPLVNAILRAAAKQRAELCRHAAATPLHVRESHPEFLVKRWSSAFGQDSAAALCRWNNQTPLTYARINTLRVDRETFLKRYSDVQPLEDHPLFVRCDTLPRAAIARGHCYIQDPSTAVAPELVDPEPGEIILDACSAPGGKTAYLAALSDNGTRIVATDLNEVRLDLLRRNLSVLGANNVEIFRQDWTTDQPIAGFSALSFDKILVDTPCTNTGVMRRRVDVRWRLAPDDFDRMHRKQLAITRAVVPLLKRGGVLVYSTCSIEQEENEKLVKDLLEHEPQLVVDTVRALLPQRDGLDGAFAVRLVRAG